MYDMVLAFRKKESITAKISWRRSCPLLVSGRGLMGHVQLRNRSRADKRNEDCIYYIKVIQ